MWQQATSLIGRCLFVGQHQIVAYRSKRLVDMGKKTRGKTPVPPTTPTVAYLNVPPKLDPVTFANNRENRYVDKLMRRDARRRQMVELYDPLRVQINCIRKSGFLPAELRSIADEEVSNLPRDSCSTRLRKRCIITSRPRGVKHQWRVSRIRFREIADHGKMSGMMFAKWKTAYT